MISNSYRLNGGRKRKHNLQNQINVTPIVDVMLVLLIIFMVTAPALIAGIDVELPQSDARQLNTKEKPLVITIDKKGDIYLMDTKIKLNDISSKLKNISDVSKQKQILIKGDKNIDYGKVIDLMGKITNAGFTKIGLISDIKK